MIPAEEKNILMYAVHTCMNYCICNINAVVSILHKA